MKEVKDLLKYIVDIVNGKEMHDITDEKNTINELIHNIKRLNDKECFLRYIYKLREESVIEDALKKDNIYQALDSKVYGKVEKLDKIKFSAEQWMIIDEILSTSNERNLEYGRIAYYQGFKDAVNLITEIL